MSHTRETEHYGLPLYDGNDIINPLTDFNNANSAIDEALYDANQRSVSANNTAEEAKDIAEGYDGRVTQAINTANDAITLANNTQDMIAEDFDPNKDGGYQVGDFVIYNGKLYRFINAHTGAWDASDVQTSPVLIEAIGEVVDEGKQAINDAVADAEEEIAGQTEKVTKTQAMIAQPFDANKSGGYAVGDIVTYADKLYKFTSAHSGAWTGLDVEQVDVIEEVSNVDEKVDVVDAKVDNVDARVDSVNSALAWQDITSQCSFNNGLTYITKKVLARKGEVQISLSISPTGWADGAFLIVLPHDIPNNVLLSGVSVNANGTPINEQTYITNPATGDLKDRTLIGYKSANTGYFVYTFIISYDN